MSNFEWIATYCIENILAIICTVMTFVFVYAQNILVKQSNQREIDSYLSIQLVSYVTSFNARLLAKRVHSNQLIAKN